jgi:phenylalanyl-tRNA synthetase beta chain
MEDEIDGLMELAEDAPVGTDVVEYLQLNDNIVEVDLTPNRGDCLSLLGLAREVGVLNKQDVSMVDVKSVPASNDEAFPVAIDAPDDCGSYAGRVIKGVDLSKPTPLWMKEKLRRSGIRSIDAVVDVTNYILLELGQPMHAFDLDELNDGIVVRKAKDEEELILLDGETIKLKEDALVIADHGKALALAGIMGGEGSGVSEKTTNILLESAFFTPEKIAGRARSYGLHTDSSHRFERGVDFSQQVRAIERATQLLLDIVGGEAGPVNHVIANEGQHPKVTLPSARLEQVLGLKIPTDEVTDILQRLGFSVELVDGAWQCEIPSYRFDISIEADLIEEIARIYGYNKLPTRKLTVPVEFQHRDERFRSESRIRHHLLAKGYQEAITYSFIDSDIQAMFSEEAPVPVKNPISSDMSVMRTSLIPGLLMAMQHNTKRQQPRVRMFETGLQFHQKEDGKVEQNKYLAGLICGDSSPESWSQAGNEVDFFDIKGDVESVLSVCGKENVSFSGAKFPGLHPGQTAEVIENGEIIGILGKLHPEVAKSLGIAGSVFVFELSLDKLLKGNVPNFKALSKFPQVRRDLAVIVDETVRASQVLDLIKENAGEWQKDCTVFDVYQGQGIDENKKSLAVGIQFQHPDRSLNDEEIQATIDTIVNQLSEQLGATLRN